MANRLDSMLDDVLHKIFSRDIFQNFNKLLLIFFIAIIQKNICPGGGIGRHKGFKILEGNFVRFKSAWAP